MEILIVVFAVVGTHFLEGLIDQNVHDFDSFGYGAHDFQFALDRVHFGSLDFSILDIGQFCWLLGRRLTFVVLLRRVDQSIRVVEDHVRLLLLDLFLLIFEVIHQLGLKMLRVVQQRREVLGRLVHFDVAQHVFGFFHQPRRQRFDVIFFVVVDFMWRFDALLELLLELLFVGGCFGLSLQCVVCGYGLAYPVAPWRPRCRRPFRFLPF